MTGRARDWLPVQAGKRPAVESRVEEAVGEWSQAWFVRRRVTVASARATLTEPAADADGGGWRRYGGSLGLSCTKRSVQKLLEWGLDLRMDLSTLTEADRRVLELMEHELFADLTRRVELKLDLKSTAGPSPSQIDTPYDRLGGVTFTLADSVGGPLMALAVPLDVVMSLCRRSLPPRRPTTAPQSRREALGRQSVTLQAVLGAAEISLSELPGLACGDVLVLNRRLDEPAALALVGSETPLALAGLTDLDGWAALTLQSLAIRDH